MIGMNALIDLECAAGTLSVECTDEQYGLSTDCVQTDQKKIKNSMDSVQTAFKLIRKR